MPTPALPRRPLHPSYLLHRRPSPHHPVAPCPPAPWPSPPATLRLRYLYLELKWLLLLPAPRGHRLHSSQLVPPTPRPTRCLPRHRLRTRLSTTLAVTCWLLYAWVRFTRLNAGEDLVEATHLSFIEEHFSNILKWF